MLAHDCAKASTVDEYTAAGRPAGVRLALCAAIYSELWRRRDNSSGAATGGGSSLRVVDNEDKHVAEHESQLVQGPMVQSVQVTPNEVHLAPCDRAGQAAPRVSGSSIMFRTRVAVPDAQAESHAPQVDQLVTPQFVTQMSVLHANDSEVVSGHGFVEAQVLVIVRVRLCIPEPQDVVQACSITLLCTCEYGTCNICTRVLSRRSSFRMCNRTRQAHRLLCL